jgi:hypothetical protein
VNNKHGFLNPIGASEIDTGRMEFKPGANPSTTPFFQRASTSFDFTFFDFVRDLNKLETRGIFIFITAGSHGRPAVLIDFVENGHVQICT